MKRIADQAEELYRLTAEAQFINLLKDVKERHASSDLGLIYDRVVFAEEKIWSIATTMASAQQTPEIRIGLVAYRDRGDAYVTRVTDLSTDLDSMYAELMRLTAQGGGDGPESVNRALADAVARGPAQIHRASPKSAKN